jgi:hypothetical protein
MGRKSSTTANKGVYLMTGISKLIRALPAALGAVLAAVAVAGVAGAQQPSNPPTVRETPTIEGEAREGRTLTATRGEWGGSPTRFAYQWRRCRSDGTNCSNIGGATAATYTVRNADVDNTLRVRVTATNDAGSATSVSRPTPVVVASSNPLPPGSPAGAVRLPGGLTSVPASSVALPNRLVISQVQFDPTVIRSRAPFIGRFRVTDTRGFVVRDALVYVLGVPYSRIGQAPEQATNMEGWAQIQLAPTARLPLRNGYYIVMFVRARKQGDNLLAGVSSRRLVQVRVARPVG